MTDVFSVRNPGVGCSGAVVSGGTAAALELNFHKDSFLFLNFENFF